MRITRDEMLLTIAGIVAKRSTCERAQVGAVIARDHRIISIGYGGAPSGMKHCFEVGCEQGPDGGCIRTVHAEANAVAFAARSGIKVEGSTIYITHSPCLDCAKLIINSGITRVVYNRLYRERRGIALLSESKTSVEQLFPLTITSEVYSLDEYEV